MPAGGVNIISVLRFALPTFLAVLLLAVYPYTPDPSGDIKRLLLSWGACGLGIVWLLAFVRGAVTFRRPQIFPALIGLFLLLYLVGTFLSPYRWISLIEWEWFASLALIYFLVTQLYEDLEDLRPLLLTFCVAMGVASVYGLMQLVNLDPFPWADRESDVYQGLPSTFGHPNFAAHTLILTILVAVYLAQTGTRWCWGLVGLYFVHLSYTGQRGGWIALAGAAALLGIGWLISSKVKKPLLATALTVGVTAVVGVVAVVSALTITAWRTGTPFPLDLSLLIRYQSYVSGTRMLLDAPILGHGPGVYKLTYPPYWTEFEQQWFAQSTRMNEHVHNDLIEVAIDAGLVVAGLYLALMVMGIASGLLIAFGAASDRRRYAGYLIAGLFSAFLIDGLFGFNLRVPVSAAFFFVMLGMVEIAWQRPVQAASPMLRRVSKIAVAVAAVIILHAGATFLSKYYLQIGLILKNQKQTEAASKYFTRGQRLAPWEASFQRYLGEIEMGRNDIDTAEEHYTRALELMPDYRLSHLPLAQIQMIKSQRNPNLPFDQKIELLARGARHAQEILEIAPQFARAEAMLGQIGVLTAAYLSASPEKSHQQQAEQYWQQAETHINNAIAFGAEDADGLYRMLAQTRIARGELEAAEEALIRAVQANPANRENWAAFHQYAQKHKRFEQLRDALYAQIARLKETEPVDNAALATAHLLLANAHENMADFGAADAAFAAAVEYGPSLPEVWTNLARYAKDHERQDFLFARVQDSTRRVRESGEKPLNHIAALNGMIEEGAPALYRATATLLANVRAPQPGTLSPADTYLWAADIFLARAEQEELASVCTVFLNLAITYSALGQFDKAETLFARTLECLPPQDHAVVAMHRGNNFISFGQQERGLETMAEAVQQFPDNMDLRWAYARALVGMNLIDSARREYEALLKEPELDPQGKKMLEQELGSLPQQ